MTGISSTDCCQVGDWGQRTPQGEGLGRREVPRHGLSTLELVLSLPLLLFIMALMINYGTVASWKVRGLAVARHALWASRDLRTGSLSSHPRPIYWPDNAGMGAHQDGNMANLEDVRVNHPIARGPVITVWQESEQTSIVVPVNEELLDPTRGRRVGSSSLQRRFPLMASLGEYRLRSRECLLDDRWQSQSMGIDDYWTRRMDLLYTLPRADGYLMRYYNAAMAILTAPCYPALRPLDRDPELLAAAARHPELGITTDFHPRLHPGATLDKELVRTWVEDLIEEIADLPETMEQAFDRLYSGEYD